jgi:threonine/homoserine/homoserine lactone efflux protein
MSLPISLSTLVAFCILNVGFALIPGPDVLCIVSNSLQRGRRAGWGVCAGMATAQLFHATCATLGLSAVLLAVPTAYLAVKTAGALYLAWLGVRMIRRPASIESAPQATPFSQPFAQGALSTLLNPKIALFAVSILPQFLDATRSDVVAQTIALCGLWIGSGTAMNLITATVAAQTRGLLRARPRVFERMQQAAGAALLALAARIAVERTR